MTRPESHTDQQPQRCCGNCKFAHLVAYKLDLLCFHGDEISVTGQSGYPVVSDYVILNGEEVGMMDGEEYDNVWADRVVFSSDVCNEWKQENDPLSKWA